MPKKLLQWGLIAFVIFYIATQPARAAVVVKSTFGALHATASGFSQMLSETTH